MTDFKAQLVRDMRVFHNLKEFAALTHIRYDGKTYTAPAVIDHTAGTERKQAGGDHAEGINRVEALLYVSLYDLGFAPRKGHMIEVEEAGAYLLYTITKSDHEDGEIILELGAYDE